MIPRRQARFAASGGVLLAFVGVFIGHTLEYLRVWGTAGVVASMTNPVHAYMLPVAAVLLVLSAVFALRLARAWNALNERLDRAANGMRRVWRGRSDHVSIALERHSTPGTRLMAIWLPLAAAQMVLYLVQENVEAFASSRPAPGLGALTGIHWAAPFVHLYVALVLACVVRIYQVVLHRREVVVERAEALLRALVRRLRTIAPELLPPIVRAVSPHERAGRQLWRRPPPLLLDF
ncbi:MAG: hypothetical protein ABSC35_02880 [Candidatus Dormibacteria bacterium]